MLQLYSSGLTVPAGGAYTFNNAVIAKGSTATQVAAATVALNQKGVYLVEVDAFGTAGAAGLYGIQIAVNGALRLDAINQMTVASGDVGSASTRCYVIVPNSNCPCDCTSTATTVQVINPATNVAVTDGHINITVTKVC